MGVRENLRQVLGPDWMSWLCPGTGACEGEGVAYPSCLPSLHGAARQSESTALLPGSVQLTDRKRESYADQLR